MIKDWSQYYTPPEIAALMVKSIPLRNVQRIVDICAGGFNLVNIASSKWPNADVYCVDLNRSKAIPKNVNFLKSDGREYTFRYLSEDNPLFEVVLANPPFGLNCNIAYLQRLGRRLKLDFTNLITENERLESSMLIANALLVKPQGYLSIILPITFLNGNRYDKVRKWLFEHYSKPKITLLPKKLFQNKEIRTVLLTLKRTSAEFSQSYNRNNLAVKSKIDSHRNISIKRGKISSNMFNRSCNKSIVHSTDIVANELIHSSNKISIHLDRLYSYGKAQLNDILIVRVGRRCGNSSIYKGANAISVSDCVLVLTPPTERVERFHEIVYSGKLSTLLCDIKRGLVQNYITINDVKNSLHSLKFKSL